MNANEYYYRRVIGAIGGTMLLFWLLINAFGLLIGFFDILLTFFAESQVGYTVAYQMIYGAGYLASFMIPVAFLKSRIKRAGFSYQPMETSIRVTPWLPLIVLAGIATVLSTAYINSSIVSIFDYSDFSSEVLWGATAQAPAAYELVLEFIVMCLVPGFCEEFLFRGAILTNLRPFGRSTAVLVSAFLFAMMHQNAEQLLYTFAAGIVLGIVYEMTGSIWCCTVLHVINNFVSVAESALFFKFPDPVTSSLAVSIFEMLLIALGVISAAILVARFFSKRNTLRDGMFGKSLPVADGYAVCPIDAGRAKKLFFTPTMIVFLILAVGQMLFLLLVAVLYGML